MFSISQTVYTVVFFSSVMLNTCWLLTAAANLFLIVLSSVYYTLGLNLHTDLVVSLSVLLFLLITMASYISERRMKLEFVKLAENRRLNQDMAAIIEKLPEGVIIVNK